MFFQELSVFQAYLYRSEARVVSERALTRCFSFFDGSDRVTGVAVDLHRARRARRKDVQSLIATQAELNWRCLAGLHFIERGQVVNWCEETSEVVRRYLYGPYFGVTVS